MPRRMSFESSLPPEGRCLLTFDGTFSVSTEDFSVSSPPYQSVASTSKLIEDLTPSPSYHQYIAASGMFNEKSKASNLDEDIVPMPASGEDGSKPRPTVHYADDFTPRTTPGSPDFVRIGSDLGDLTASISTTITDDENSDNYDWSGEEDLVDEEAKFEERMGVDKIKNNHWGFTRCVYFEIFNLASCSPLPL